MLDALVLLSKFARPAANTFKTKDGLAFAADAQPEPVHLAQLKTEMDSGADDQPARHPKRHPQTFRRVTESFPKADCI